MKWLKSRANEHEQCKLQTNTRRPEMELALLGSLLGDWGFGWQVEMGREVAKQFGLFGARRVEIQRSVTVSIA
jgi:hypothetical protein